MDYLKRMFESDKAKTALIDAVASTVTLVAVRFFAPNDAEFAIKLVAIYQPFFIALFIQSARVDALRAKVTALYPK